MKYLQLLKVVSLSSLGLIAFFLLAAGFSHAISSIPAREIYYQISENHTYVKKSGNTLSFYKSQDSPGRLLLLSKFEIRKNRFNSQILIPIEKGACNQTYVIDYHNSLTSSGYNTIWLSEQATGIAMPPCVAVELPFANGNLNYKLPDCTSHKAVIINKKAWKELEVITRVPNSYLRDILPPDTIPGTIEEAEIHTIENLNGTVTLYIRKNCLECNSYSTGERGGWLYPCFYYNPSYPNYVFCTGGSSIINRQCKDIFLVCGDWNFEYSIQRECLENWYCISLDPLTIQPVADGTKFSVVNADETDGHYYYGPFIYDVLSGTELITDVPGGSVWFSEETYETRYFTSDHLGSTRMVTGASGTVLGQYDYALRGKVHKYRICS